MPNLSRDELRRQSVLACLAMIAGLDSDELDRVLQQAGLDPHTATPEAAARALKDAGYRPNDRRTWTPWRW